MNVQMTDTVETAFMAITELDPVPLNTDQEGLKVLSQADGKTGGMAAINFVLHLGKGANLDLPGRLAKRLIDAGHATAAHAGAAG